MGMIVNVKTKLHTIVAWEYSAAKRIESIGSSTNECWNELFVLFLICCFCRSNDNAAIATRTTTLITYYFISLYAERKWQFIHLCFMFHVFIIIIRPMAIIVWAIHLSMTIFLWLAFVFVPVFVVWWHRCSAMLWLSSFIISNNKHINSMQHI